MKITSLLTAAGLAAASTTAAFAGGFERSTQPMGFMFEKGTYAELSFGSANPTVQGFVTAAPAAQTGDIAKSYSTFGLAIKTDLSPKLSLGLSLDPSLGADIAYPTGTAYPLCESNATLRGDTIALIAKYRVTDAVSVMGGLRYVGIGGNVTLANGGTTFYTASITNSRKLGYLVGVAYEKPEIAARVALTYTSQTSHDLDFTGTALPAPGAFAATTNVKLPQTLTLDFQSGVAKDTLVFGSIRWVDWTATRLDAPNAGAANPLVSYAHDSITYTLGVGRKFSDAFAGSIAIGYEKHHGGTVGNLGPTDGQLSLQLGGTYTRDNMKISAGVRYVDIGNATALGGAATFAGNRALAVGIKVGFSF